jgi:hemerythrin
MTRDGPGFERRLRFESARISSQHEKLNELYADLRRELARSARHNAFVCFGRFRDALEAHFEVEDRLYFPAVHGFHPHEEPLLSELAREHETFRKELATIGRLLEAHEHEESEELLARLVARLILHEQKEDALLTRISVRRTAGAAAGDPPPVAGAAPSAPFAPVKRAPVDPE